MRKYKLDSSLTKADQNAVKNFPPRGKDWHRRAVGGRWDLHGPLQMDFLKQEGMKPFHTLLDVGCGSLRGGIKFISYLNPGRYYGIDHNQEILDAAINIEIPKHKLSDKRPTIAYAENFDLPFEPPEGGFNFMIAQSVFTHIDPPEIRMCLEKLVPLLTPKGKFFATFCKSPRNDTIKCEVPYPTMCLYPFEWFVDVAEDLDIGMKYIGDWGHPGNVKGNQLMLCFHRKINEI